MLQFSSQCKNAIFSKLNRLKMLKFQNSYSEDFTINKEKSNFYEKH